MSPTPPLFPDEIPERDRVLLDGVPHRIVERTPRYAEVLQPDGKTRRREVICTDCRAERIPQPYTDGDA